MFLLLSNEENVNLDLLQAIKKKHIQSLRTACASYFPNHDLETTQYDWIRNPFFSTVWQNLDFELRMQLLN